MKLLGFVVHLLAVIAFIGWSYRKYTETIQTKYFCIYISICCDCDAVDAQHHHGTGCHCGRHDFAGEQYI